MVGGNMTNYMHTALAMDRCNANEYIYSAELTCLNNGVASTNTTLNVGTVNVYHIPEAGIDFVFENCSVTPIDNCGTRCFYSSELYCWCCRCSSCMSG